jgi:hypothetical protein
MQTMPRPPTIKLARRQPFIGFFAAGLGTSAFESIQGSLFDIVQFLVWREFAIFIRKEISVLNGANSSILLTKLIEYPATIGISATLTDNSQRKLCSAGS